MTIGSLFSGIGGLELGLERAGLGPVRWQVEADEWCQRVLSKHWPDARRFDNVVTVGREQLEPVDVICGGFPCQDISQAGTGQGLQGKRSGLWFEFLRIIRELLPQVVVVENVAALLGRGLGEVLGGLASSGYDCEWDCVPAQAVGAPHRRDRLFVVAWRISDADGSPLLVEPKRGDGSTPATDGGDSEPLGLGGQVADADGGRRKAKRERRILNEKRKTLGDDLDRCDVSHEWPPGPDDLHAWRKMPTEAQPAICRVAHGVPAGLDARRLRALGNAVVPQVAEVIGKAAARRVL